MDYYFIGQRIRKMRKANALSQEMLAEKIGISTTHMSHIETGNTKLSLAVLVNLSEALHVSTDSLLFAPSAPDKKESLDNIVALLSDCDPRELLIITDMIKALKSSLAKNEK